MATLPSDGEAASGTVVEVYQPGYRLGEGHHRPRACRSRVGLKRQSDAARPDYYKTLGSIAKRPRGDQEGLPQTRAGISPRHEPRRQEGRGALQGDLTSSRRARGPREAQAVRQRQRALHDRRRSRRRFGDFPTSTSTAPRWATSSPTSSGGRRGAGGARGRPQRTRTERGADLEAQVSISFEQSVQGGQVPLQVPMHTTCDTCHGTGAKPAPRPPSAAL